MELFRLDDAAAYRAGYVCIRQLALVLRNASLKPAAAAKGATGKAKAKSKAATKGNKASKVNKVAKVAKGKAMVRKGRIKKDNMCPPVLDRRDKMEWHHCRHLPFRHLSVRPTLLGCSLPLHFR